MRNSKHSEALVRFALVFIALAPVALFGQERSVWSTARDIREGTRGSMVGSVESLDLPRLTLMLAIDGDSQSVRVTGDELTTSFRGFGDASAKDILAGSAGFAKVKVGDRLQVTGIGGRSTVAATDITLLGRSSTSKSRTVTLAPSTSNRVEGIVRSVNTADNRIVVETSDRKLYTVRGTTSTPVRYQGQTYRISEIESGDQVRVNLTSGGSPDDLRAASIDVVRNVRSDGTAQDSRTLTSTFGRISRIDTRNQTVRLQTDRETVVTVDLRNATDRSGRVVRVADLNVGDSIEVSGQYDASRVFVADTVRMAGERDQDTTSDPNGTSNGGYQGTSGNGTGTGVYDQNSDVFDREGRYRSETLDVTVDESLASNDALRVRERNGDRRRLTVLVDQEMLARTASGSYITAAQIRAGERITIRAFLAPDGTYIAQTIRVR